MKTLQGISVSRGIDYGPVYQYKTVRVEFATYQPADRRLEWERFEKAVSLVQEKLERLYARTIDEVGADEAAIFQAHIMILQDPDLIDSIQEKILEEGTNAEAALATVSEAYCRMLEEVSDEYIRARVLDIRDVRTSILRVLLGVDDQKVEVTEPSIIVSRDLTPSDCVSIPKTMIKGFCTVEGGATSHTAILARSLGVPAIAGVPEEVLAIGNGETIILDGSAGQIILQPEAETIRSYAKQRDAKKRSFSQALEESHQPAVTQDGHPVQVFANTGSDSQEDLEQAVKNGAEGVGLLRTEFIYLDCTEMPTEEDQFRKYKSVVEVFGDRPVILRTLDIGGDKQLPYLDLPTELNPFLGVRGLRLCLRNIPLFKTQLRAALRAAAFGRLRLMFPMVTKVSEVTKARALVEECRSELRAEGRHVPDAIEIGIMIEVPAAALLADHLAREVDFFSIGTNDLSQYTLAVDRTNTNLTDLASAFDPSVLLLIHQVVQAAHRHGKVVGLCGELAGDPLAVPILVGLGVDELSMNIPAVPIVKQIIRKMKRSDTEKLAKEVLQMETPAEVKQFVSDQMPFILEIR